jgi:hypothetical protein
MLLERCRFFSIILFAWALSEHSALAAVRPLAEATIYQFGGPETRTRCTGMTDTFGGPPKYCTAWATDFMQHGVYVQMWGPSDMDKGQLQTIKDACFFSAVVGQIPFINFTAGIDAVMSTLLNIRPTLDSALLACLKTTQILGNVAVKDFRLEVVRRNFW